MLLLELLLQGALVELTSLQGCLLLLLLLILTLKKRVLSELGCRGLSLLLLLLVLFELFEAELLRLILLLLLQLVVLQLLLLWRLGRRLLVDLTRRGGLVLNMGLCCSAQAFLLLQLVGE